MTSAARISFGCCGVISVEDDAPLEATGASWVCVASVRAIKFALGKFRGAVRRNDILQWSNDRDSARGESRKVFIHIPTLAAFPYD
jgi:hypothetical protein